MTDLAVGAITGLILLSLIVTGVLLLRTPDARAGYLTTIRAIRWWMWPAALLHVVSIAAAVTWLMTTVPMLQFGWWALLGGDGNVVLGQTGRQGVWSQVVAFIVPLLLFALIPQLAYQEELLFRHGSEHDSPLMRLRRQAIFGLAHSLFAGVPIAAGVVLIGSGILYEAIYIMSMKKLLGRTELVPVSESPPRREFPASPSGPYDPAAWDAHHVAVKEVMNENRRLLDEWLDSYVDERVRRDGQVEELRRSACAVAAAFHSCSNFVIVAALLAVLIFM